MQFKEGDRVVLSPYALEYNRNSGAYPHDGVGTVLNAVEDLWQDEDDDGNIIEESDESYLVVQWDGGKDHHYYPYEVVPVLTKNITEYM
jgi:hypothetical protein